MKKLKTLFLSLLFVAIFSKTFAQTWDIAGNKITSTPQINALIGTDATSNISALKIIFNGEDALSVEPNTIKSMTGYNVSLGYRNSFVINSAAASSSYVIGNNNRVALNACYTFGNNNILNQIGEENSFAIGTNINTISDMNNRFFAIGHNIMFNGNGGFVLGTGVDGRGIWGVPLEGCIEKNSLTMGFNSDIPTFFVGPSAGMGTTGNIGIGGDGSFRFGGGSFTSAANLPQYKLDVYGDFRATLDGLFNQNLTVENNLTVGNDEFIGRDLTVNRTIYTQSLDARDKIISHGTLGVGISSNPVASIHTSGKICIGEYTSFPSYGSGININTQYGDGILIERSAVGWTNTKAKIFLSTYSGKKGLRFLMTPDGFTGSSGNPSWGIDAFFIAEDGTVGIGTTNPQNKLDVNGTIRAKRVVVATNWPDYVFAPTYKLMDLYKVEDYINKNKHLPEIPSECEVEEKGLSIGEMQTLQMKKIEELTLYIIDLKKEIDVLKANVNK